MERCLGISIPSCFLVPKASYAFTFASTLLLPISSTSCRDTLLPSHSRDSWKEANAFWKERRQKEDEEEEEDGDGE
ncbi:hypothetical protein C369_07273 [Cryptococcus neoformans A5-35-17]|nr:hypothetical protein C369_07273 [Cryptococcus neoformans var. grubii A5-35-17]